MIGVKYKDGVVLAADNLASYGSLARFRGVHRLKVFNKKVVCGFSGDVSDMQYIDRLLLSLDIDEKYSDDDMSANNLHKYLSKVMYKRRSDINPLWNAILVAGLNEEDKPYLAFVDLLGTVYEAPSLATGYGAHLAQPIMRRAVPDEAAAQRLDRDGAIALVKECMKVLFYRDARSLDEYSMAVIDAKGVDLDQSIKLENQSWAFADRIKGYGTQEV